MIIRIMFCCQFDSLRPSNSWSGPVWSGTVRYGPVQREQISYWELLHFCFNCCRFLSYWQEQKLKDRLQEWMKGDTENDTLQRVKLCVVCSCSAADAPGHRSRPFSWPETMILTVGGHKHIFSVELKNLYEIMIIFHHNEVLTFDIQKVRGHCDIMIF